MVILYQIAIFTIIILSSFVGFKGLFISVSLIVGFSLTNIFTIQLLIINVIQLKNTFKHIDL